MSTYKTTLSDSDISLNLSEGSVLSSESDLSLETLTKSTNKKLTMAEKHRKKPAKPKKASNSTTTTTTASTASQPKKGNKQIKDEEVYCICRQGYDGKQFMIACDTCHEWFHGQCIGINPKSVTKHYYCDTCQSKTVKKKSTNQDRPPKVTANGKGRGKKKATTTSSRKKSNQDANTSISISIPLTPAPPTTQPTTTPTTTMASTTMDQDDEDEDLDDICPICEFECTCGTSSTSAAAPLPVSVPIVQTPSASSLDTPLASSSTTTKKGTVKKQPKTQSAKSKKSKTAKKMAQYTPLSDEEDVDILDDIDDTHFDKSISAVASTSDDNDDDNLVMDPFSADEELSSGDDSDPQLDYLSLDHDSQFGSYSSSIHIDSGDDDEEDIEQEEERAIIAEMMENGLSDNNSATHQDQFNDSDDDEANGEYYIEDDYSEDLDGNELDEDSSDSLDENDGDIIDDEEAHAYYLRTNGLWASSSEEEEEDDDENMGFHSDPGPLHDASDEDDTTADLAALIGGDNNLFTNIAEAFMHVLAPLANVHNSHSDALSPTSLTTPASALPLNVATFDLGSNAADYLNSAPTSPVSHRMDDFLRRPSLPSSAVLAANGHHDTDLASDALSMLSSVLSSEALGLPLHHHTSTTAAASDINKDLETVNDEDANELPVLIHHHHHHHREATTATSAPSLSSTTSSLSPSSSSPPQPSTTPTVSSPTATHDATAAITPINYTESSSPSPPSPPPQQGQQLPSAADIHSPIAPESSGTQPASPQPSYDLASLLPPDMKIPDQLMELIKSSLAASINEKGLLSTPSTTTTTTSSSAEQQTGNKKTSPESSTSSRQLLPKPSNTTSDGTSSLDAGPSNGTAAESDKKRPLSIVTQFGKKRQRGDDDTGTTEGEAMETQDNDNDDDLDDMIVSMDELLDTSQLDAARPDDNDDNDISDDRFVRDLSRWERVPIGAFRLMRSKNRLWLNR